MATIIAVLNEKGGVGKTTTVTEVAYHLGNANKKTLVIDLDSQRNATTHMAASTAFEFGIYDLLTDDKDEIPWNKCLVSCKKSWQKTLLIPGTKKLSQLNTQLQDRFEREKILKNVLQKFQDKFDFILIDLPPNISIVTTNALVAASHFLVPTDTSDFSKGGIKAILNLANLIKKTANPDLKFLGAFIVRYQKANSLAVKAAICKLEEDLGENLLDLKINDSVRIGESQNKGLPVADITSDCQAIEAYAKLTNIIIDGAK